MIADPPTQIVLGIISLAGTVITAILAYLASRSSRAAKVESRAAVAESRNAREAITNGHEAHIRDELDRRFDSIDDRIAAGFTEVRTELRGVRADVGRAVRRVEKVDDRITEHERRMHLA